MRVLIRRKSEGIEMQDRTEKMQSEWDWAGVEQACKRRTRQSDQTRRWKIVSGGRSALIASSRAKASAALGLDAASEPVMDARKWDRKSISGICRELSSQRLRRSTLRRGRGTRTFWNTLFNDDPSSFTSRRSLALRSVDARVAVEKSIR